MALNILKPRTRATAQLESISAELPKPQPSGEFGRVVAQRIALIAKYDAAFQSANELQHRRQTLQNTNSVDVNQAITRQQDLTAIDAILPKFKRDHEQFALEIAICDRQIEDLRRSRDKALQQRTLFVNRVTALESSEAMLRDAAVVLERLSNSLAQRSVQGARECSQALGIIRGQLQTLSDARQHILEIDRQLNQLGSEDGV